jgi:hypothetical protein
MPSSCIECRYGSLRHNKIADGKNAKGETKYQILTKYHCAFDNITHAIDQTGCPSYLGWMNLFEYLSSTQPQALHDVLKKFNLRIRNSRNPHGFDIIGD